LPPVVETRRCSAPKQLLKRLPRTDIDLPQSRPHFSAIL
jgi:hypothetical protein